MMEPYSDDLLTNMQQYTYVDRESRVLKWKMNRLVPNARKDKTYSNNLTIGCKIAQISISYFTLISKVRIPFKTWPSSPIARQRTS